MANKNFLKTVLTTGFIAGALDGTAATIQVALSGASNPFRVFNFVASGVFGEQAFSGGQMMMLLGVLFHLTIATVWSVIFVVIYPYIRKIISNWMIAGLGYGIVVWTCMNLIVLPLSNIATRDHSFKSVLIGMTIIILCVGFPIAYNTYRSIGKQKR